MSKIEVSVICLVYNQSKYIRKCLDSLVNQKTSFKYEILIHDDASTDDTIRILKEYEEKNPQLIRIFFEQENQYSKGKKVDEILYQAAKGKYFAFCEGDDFWTDPLKLQTQFDIMEANLNCTICVHKVRKINESGKMLNSVICPPDLSSGIIKGDYFLKNYLEDKKGMFFQTSSYFIRREMIVERPNELNVFSVGDVPMILWAASKGDIYYLDNTFSNYRVLAEGSTNQLLKDINYAIRRIKTNILGFEAFNRLTEGKYWEYMKRRIAFYKIQCFFLDKSYKEEMKTIKSELPLKKIVIARIKFTRLGNFLRNIRSFSKKYR